MTLLNESWIKFTLPNRDNLVAPTTLNYSDISVIIPVKDNREGVNQFLKSFFETHQRNNFPKEIILVDNCSKVPLTVPDQFQKYNLSIKTICCLGKGPAYARNAGSREARGAWLLFTDSDCVPTETFLSGYFSALNGAVAYAGNVKALGTDRLSSYYESQQILVPPKVHTELPHYLVTANALVWRDAFDMVEGFDETYPLAGGEDIDLGFRLSEIGELAYALASCVVHDFGDGYRGFVKRFVRYGEGNGLLGRRYGIDLSPRRFVPNKVTLFNRLAAYVQYWALSRGYHRERESRITRA